MDVNVSLIILANTAACCLLALFCLLIVPAKWRHGLGWLLIALPGVVIPALSVLGPLIMTAMMIYLARLPLEYRVQRITFNQLFSHDEQVQMKAPGSARKQLYSEQSTDQAREQALLMINAYFRPEGNVLNHQVLSFNSQEIRLYAFYLLSAQENQLYDMLNQLEKQLKEPLSDEQRGQCYQHIAYIYWRMVALNLESANIVALFVQSVAHYVQKAWDCGFDTCFLWIVMGKVHHYHQNYEKAMEFFDGALEKGALLSETLPEYPQILYHWQHFRALKAFWRGISSFQGANYFQIKRFWTGEGYG